MLPRFIGLGVLSLALPLLTFKNVQAQSVPEEDSAYPDEYVEQYISDCASGQSEEVEAVCRCVIREVQDRFSFEEFQNMNQQIEETGEISSDLQIIIDVCYEHVT